ncbi:hypothetical protein JNB11_03775 [Kocuria palustris]|nr:hypothetical protein [Kocuria palustris]
MIIIPTSPRMLEPNLLVTGDISSSISTFTVGESDLCDPVNFIETHFQSAKEHGALKFRLPSSTSSQLNIDSVWFHTTKQVINPPDDDLALRLDFYRLLADFITSMGGDYQATISTIPKFENRQLDLYRLFKLVQTCGGFMVVTASHTWHIVAKQLGYRFVDENMINALYNAYGTILQPYESHELIVTSEPSPKRPKLEKSAPLVLGSAQPFCHSLITRLAKGFLLNAQHHLDLKHPITIQLLALILPQSQIHLIIRTMFENKDVQCDDVPLTPTTSVYSLSQFVERDRSFSCYLQQKHHEAFTHTSISAKDFEALFWKLLEGKDNKDKALEVELGFDLSTRVYETPFYSIVDDLLSKKSNSDNSPPMRELLSPWATENLPFSPNLLLATLSETDVTNPNLIRRRGQIGMTFSLKNWRCQENFCQLVDRHILGAPKLWYFIPESQFEKFEDLIGKCQCHHRVHVNNNQWNGEKYKEKFNQLQPDTICQCLHLMVDTTTEPRLIQQAIDTAKLQPHLHNQEHVISPTMLIEEGITFTLVLQYPGEYIVVPPKTYACTISLGLNVSEEVNIATPLWMNYAIEGERWMTTQNLIPTFSTFKLLANILNPTLDLRPFSSKVITMALHQLLDMIDNELKLRHEALGLIKEAPLDEQADEDLADDNLSWCFPLKVIVTHENGKFCTLLSQYLTYYRHCKAEVQYHYTDDKLRGLQKVLEGDTFTYHNWVAEYSKVFDDYDAVPHLKSYKSLLSDGETILLALYTREAALTDSTPTSPDFVQFLSMVNNLRQFVAAADSFIDECQALLAIKHSQRVRKGLEVTKASLAELTHLVQKVDELDFTLTETEQILDLQREVLNFDKALRALLAKLRSTEVEFNDLINLGELFGIEIPALNFITRIRDRMKWHKTYSVLEKGGDPFADSKDVFTLVDLEEFYNDGLRILPRQDQQMIDRVSQMIAELKAYDEEVRRMLDVQFIDDISPSTLDGLADRFRSERLFLQRDSYDQLLRVHDCRKLISKAQILCDGSKTLLLSELKPLLSAIKETDLPFRAASLSGPASQTEAIVQNLATSLRSTQVITTMDKSLKDINAKGAHNALLVQKLYQLLYKADFSFSRSDDYFKSSLYQEISSEEVIVQQPIYCTCRELEFGTMVECEKCCEWYHVLCVKLSRSSKKAVNDSFVCGPCQLLATGEYDQYLKNQMATAEFLEHAMKFKTLEVIPQPEVEAVKELVEKIKTYHRQLDLDLSEFLKSDRPNLIKLDYVRFLVRKIYGAGLLWRENLEVCLKSFAELKPLCSDVIKKKVIAIENTDNVDPIQDTHVEEKVSSVSNLQVAPEMPIKQVDRVSKPEVAHAGSTGGIAINSSLLRLESCLPPSHESAEVTIAQPNELKNPVAIPLLSSTTQQGKDAVVSSTILTDI